MPVGHADFGKAFPCPDCVAPMIAMRQQAAMQQHMDSLIESAGIPPRHRYTFEDFYALPDDCREGKEEAAAFCHTLSAEGRMVVNGVVKVGILLFGSFGTLKTTLGTAALLEQAAAGTAVLRVKFADLLDDVKDTYGRKDKHAEDIIRAAQTAPFALLDDMGDPKVCAELSPDQRRIAHKILEYRNEYVLPTIVTTNCTLAQLEKQLTTRTYERVRELCHMIEVTGANLRQ